MAHTYKEFDWYEVPRYYDMIFDIGTRAECDFLAAMYERHAPTGKRRILEPACGSGRLVAAMAARGYRVLGLDISEGSLAYARARIAELHMPHSRVARPRVIHQDMASFTVARTFDLAHCLVSSFLYLESEARARSHLACVARALEPGGIYVLGLHLSEYGRETLSRERWVAERDGVKVVCNIQTWPPERHERRRQMRSRLVIERDGAVERYQTLWHFRTYDVRQLRRLIASVPAFEHLATHDFDLDAERPADPERLGEERLDQVLILRRRR